MNKEKRFIEYIFEAIDEIFPLLVAVSPIILFSLILLIIVLLKLFNFS